jgi:hypothetical protein
MSKKHFIDLANTIREHNWHALKNDEDAPYSLYQLDELASFCQRSNPRFNKSRWLAYIAGECGPNGGKVKA